MPQTTTHNHIPWQDLAEQIEGEVLTDVLSRNIYATDASVYREIPIAVVYPKHKEDLQKIVRFARKHQVGITARSGGTSLAGQCVTDGIVIDVSRYMNKVLEINEKEKWVRLQPGVVRDELNYILKEHNLFFGPNTSTANRAMIGGMVGNNSSGSYSLVYGTTRDHVISVEAVLSSGETATFESLTTEQFNQKKADDSFEGSLYRQIDNLLASPENRKLIAERFPKPVIHRRNTGYALDVLSASKVFESEGTDFNYASLLSGSEGTLCLFSEIKLNLVERPPEEILLLAVHYATIQEALRSVTTILNFQPRAVELMDSFILECTRDIPAQKENRFFVKGEPDAMLLIEIGAGSRRLNLEKAEKIITQLKARQMGYHYPLIEGSDIPKAWKLREAGLGALSNLKGDAKPVAVVEDTAVDPADLAAYIGGFTSLMEQFGQKSVYYAHAGAGELHLRPILNLKEAEGVKQFRKIGEAVAKLVKEYNGSLSGEHGDGRVRSEFIREVFGDDIVRMFETLKDTWDPHNLFNPGKIVRPVKMDSSLRYKTGQQTREIDTQLDFSEAGGILRAAEKCNGAGDCRKLALSGGVMCPSYMATRNEKHTTRARANTLREFLTNSSKHNPFDHEEIKDVLDLCLSCKGCTAECPSSVDMAAMKAEFLHHYHQANGVPIRDKLFASVYKTNKLAATVPAISNWLMNKSPLSAVIKSLTGIAPQRNIPELYKIDLLKWWKKNQQRLIPEKPLGKIHFFADEFTRFNDTEAGIKTIIVFAALGFEVNIPEHTESGRAMISKGMLNKARRIAEKNIDQLYPVVNESEPLIGIEPSAILSFRDEYPKLVSGAYKQKANELKKHVMLPEEFLMQFLSKNPEMNFSSLFDYPGDNISLHIHGHCHQKAFSSVQLTADLLIKLLNTKQVNIIPSGCCGMAGSFGYEKEHYALSKDIAQLVLIPYIDKLKENDMIVAPGTSCRHQISDFAHKESLHPFEVLFKYLFNKKDLF